MLFYLAQEFPKQLQKILEKLYKKINWGSFFKNIQKDIKELRNRSAHPSYRGTFQEITIEDIELALINFENNHHY